MEFHAWRRRKRLGGPSPPSSQQIPAPLAIRRIRAFQMLMDQALEDREGPV